MEEEHVIFAPCQWTIPVVTEVLTLRGYRVQQSFDLRSALHHHDQCPCPHHGTEQCTCEYMVLFVYGQMKASSPVTMIAHGRDGITWLHIRTARHRDVLSTELRSALEETANAALSAA